MSAINSFLGAFSQDSKFFLPLPFLWKVDIRGVSAGAINSVLSKAGESWGAKTVPDSFIREGNILVAQEVTLPSESFEVASFGQQNRGGFLPGYGVTQRADFLNRGITINFLETGDDIEHNFFRPWTIALGIDGLINQSLKGDITVKQYAQDGTFRKGYTFNQAFPTNCEGYTLNYNDSEFKVKTVTFACRNYKQL